MNDQKTLKNWEDPIDSRNLTGRVRIDVPKYFNKRDQKQEIIEVLKALEGVKKKLQKLIK